MSWYMYASLTVSIVAVTGNGFVAWLITTRSNLHNTTNWFILSLAVSDFLVGLSLTPLFIACKELGTCDVYLKSAFEELILYESIFNLCAMTVDRYIAIVYPLKYPSCMTTTGAVKKIAISWGIPLVNFGLHFSWLYAEPATRTTWFRVFTIIETIFMVAVPCIVLLVANTQIIRVAQLQSRRTIAQLHEINFNQMEAISTSSCGPSEHPKKAVYKDKKRQTKALVNSQENSLSDHKPSSRLEIRSHKEFRRRLHGGRLKRSSVKVIIAVITIFLVCWSLSLYASFCRYLGLCNVTLTLGRLTWLFMILNSAINPIVFILFKSDLRAEFTKMWICMAVLKRNATITSNKQSTLKAPNTDN